MSAAKKGGAYGILLWGTVKNVQRISSDSGVFLHGLHSGEGEPENALVRFEKGQEPELSINIPMVSAIMQSVSDDRLAVALAQEGGMAFIYGSQPAWQQAEMVRRVKRYRAGFVVSDSNVSPDMTLRDVLELTERTGHSTVAVTETGENGGKLLGIVTNKDYRVSRMSPDTKVSEFMTPMKHLICGKKDTTLKAANDIIWEHKLNSLPIVDDEGRLMYFIFRKDYSNHKENPLELLDAKKRYMVGAGINTRDYEERVPALVDAGADVLCIDSSEGFTEWQKITLDYIHKKYGRSVKVGAGNVVEETASASWPKRERTLSRSVSAAAPSVSPESRRESAADRLRR